MPDDNGNPFNPFPSFPNFPTTPRDRALPNPRSPRDAGLPLPIPVPIPPPVPTPGVVIPFPVPQPPIPPAVSAPSILGRILAGGTISIGVGTVIVGVIEASRGAIERKRKLEEELDKAAVLEGIRRQNERIERDNRVKTEKKAAISKGNIEIETLPPPEFPTAPARAPQPVFDPVPIELPAPTPELPSPQPAPVTIPAPAPVPAPVPAPSRVPRPATSPRPVAVPGTFPSRLPAFFPIPQFRPGSSPRFRIGDNLAPSSGTNPLTSFNTGTVSSLLPTSNPQPQPETDKRCKEVKRRRRRKGKCYEGFYKEFPGKTQFTEWREVDCVSRRETTKSKLKNRGFNVDDVISFP